ncbi:MAG: FdhF/YdeP family oxidoreductase [Planctomycetota bacterium]
MPGAQPPADFTGLRTSAPGTVAGGPAAVAVATKHVWSEVGPLRGTLALLRMNQHAGFDCPGCAWPDPADPSTVEFCENGAKALAEEATTRRVTPAFFARHSIEHLQSWSDYKIGKAGRLTTPMVRREGGTHYEPISWDDAFALIARELNALPSPDEAVFYASGRTSNEAAFLWQLFVRQYGTNNLPDCSNLCHESSGTGLKETIGVGKGTVTLDDFYEHTDTILVIGQNPGTNHPRMLTALQAAARRGATIISINPLREAGLVRFRHPQEIAGWVGSGTPLAKWFVPVRINGDVALLTGVAKRLLERHDAAAGSESALLDTAFIEQHTKGFERFAAHTRAIDWTDLVASSGISQPEIEALADQIAQSKALITCWAMGLTQHRNAVGNVQAIVNLHLMLGQIGKPGAGVCPVRGHSNVQGDRTVGITPNPPADLLDHLEREFAFVAPRDRGLDTVHAIAAMHDGRAHVFVGLGGNFLSASPDTEYTARALQQCRLTVHVSTKLNRSHLITGRQALILPCLGRSEMDEQNGHAQVVSVENSMGIVHTSRGHLAPASRELLSEPRIVARMAAAVLGEKTTTKWSELADNYDTIRGAIERCVPGFSPDYNARVRQPGGFPLPNPVRDSRTFPTSDGKAHFTVHAVPQHELADGQLLMMTIRSHDQYNTTIYGLDDRYRGIRNERRVVLVSRGDMAALGLTDQQVVDITSHWEGETRVAKRFLVVPYDIPPGCCATYFPEANVLVPVRHFAEKSHTPVSKSLIVSLAATATAAAELAPGSEPRAQQAAP